MTKADKSGAAETLAERVFTMGDQADFARLSGDFNPLHVDPVAARRLLFGRPVVHGVHGLLWALDRFAARVGMTGMTEVKASFDGPIFPGQAVTLRLRADDGGKARLEVVSGGATTTRIRLAYTVAEARPWAGATEPPAGDCRERGEAEFDGASGRLTLHLPPADAARLFPELDRRFDPRALAVLAAATRLVGMECPGLHSVFNGLTVAFDPAAEAATSDAALDWRVTKRDPRFPLLEMSIGAPGAAGTIDCALRPPPALQPSYREVRATIEPDAFAGQTALVVGGSRGLGEITAKLVAAGGGMALVTYHSGAAEAEALVREIAEAGGKAAALALDVASLTDEAPPALPQPATHCYYFASPRITPNRRKGFDGDAFRNYCRYYVDPLEPLVGWLAGQGDGAVTFFYPSTVFIDEAAPGFAEYAAAKAAGEALGRQLQHRQDGLTFLSPRLPRLRTDQTSGLIRVEQAEPLDVLRIELARLGGAG